MSEPMFLAAAFLFAGASPQETDPEAQIPEVLITAPREERVGTATDATVQVIRGEDLVATGERSLPRAISVAGGIFVQETNLGGGAPILRGLLGNQILIIVDGVRLNDSTTRIGPNQALNSIDPATVERVEIYRGSAAVIYGSDAIGGVVRIWTKRRAPASGPDGERRFGGFVDLTYESAAKGGRGAVGVSGATEDHGWLGIASFQDWEDLRAGGGETQDFTGFNGNDVFGSWIAALGDERQVRVSGSISRQFDVPRTDRLTVGFGQTVPANAEWDYALQDRQRLNVAYDDFEGGFLADRFQIGTSFAHYDERRQIRSTGSSTRRLESDSVDTLGLRLDASKGLGEQQLLKYGFDLYYDEVDSSRRNLNIGTGVSSSGAGAFAPDSSYLQGGVFVQDEIFAFDPVWVTAGVRFSFFQFSFDDVSTGKSVDGNFDDTTASLQVAYDVSDSTRISATAAQGFRAPNLSELAKNGSFFGGEQLANPNLDPEQSVMGELALETTHPTWSATLALYRTEISDTIGRILVDPGTAAAGDETYMRENVGSLSVHGVEGRLRRSLFEAGSPWSLGATAEYTHGRQDDDFIDPNTGQRPFENVPARRIPPFHGSLALRNDSTGIDHLSWAELSWVWALEQSQLNPEDIGDPRIDPDGTDAWSTLNLNFGGPIGKRDGGSTWRVGLLNLFDESYRVHGSGFDAAGFGVTLGVHLSR